MMALLVTSEGACGIAEHSAYLKAAVEAADLSLHITLHTDLHPRSVHTGYDLIWLNYHAALHSQWTPEWIHHFKAAGVPVGCTWHDTGVPNSDHCKSIYAVADVFVVHEPCPDPPNALYWRQGVPARQAPWVYAEERRPLLGTCGFDFPWKNFAVLREAAAEAGWGLTFVGGRAEAFLPRDAVVSHLAGCDATAFLYHCHNTGTSGAIRQGLAARKPVIASDVQVPAASSATSTTMRSAAA